MGWTKENGGVTRVTPPAWLKNVRGAAVARLLG